MSLPIITITIKEERDVVLARQRARQVSGLLGFDTQDQTRIATAVSEIARNAFSYGRGGRAELSVEGTTSPQVLLVRIVDQGPGIMDVEHVMSGEYRSRTGMGIGLIGSRRLMDGLEVRSSPKGTEVLLKKILPRSVQLLGRQDAARIAGELARQRAGGPLEEIQQQNQELLSVLGELRRRQNDLERLNNELEDTNRGVVALYAELDEKADHLRRADHLKTRFLSDMSHEFRTPLNSVIAMARILKARIDGPLTKEQQRQVDLIEGSAHDLLSLVNDLLDLAKVEAGKIDIRPIEFRAADLFGALRGMMRPLLVAESVHLHFDDAEHMPMIYSDEAKVSQIIRNFIANALKFTERGEVRVSASCDADAGMVSFAVRDTGIGIAPENHERIFEEFSQIDSPAQRKVKGTGLGLPLTRKLAGLLGGSVSMESTSGLGSTFRLTIPVLYRAPVSHEAAVVAKPPALEPDRMPVLVVEDNTNDLLACEKFLAGTRFQPLAVRTVSDARRALREQRPAAIVLDARLQGEDSWKLLSDIKSDAELASIPVLMVTSVEDEAKASMLGADAFCLKPLRREWLLEQLDARVQNASSEMRTT